VDFLKNKRFLAIDLTHLSVDIFISQRSILLTFIAVTLGKDNAWLGLMTTLAIFFSGLTQPFFGWLSDRVGSKKLIVGGLGWIMICFTVMAFLPVQYAPALLIAANLGAGAFHPAGATQSILIGKEDPKKREALATSVFFLGGQLAFFIGPLLGGLLLDSNGKSGYLWFLVFTLPVLFWTNHVLRDGLKPIQNLDSSKLESQGEIAQVGILGAILVFVILATQAWSQQTVITYAPKYVAGLGEPAKVYGAIAAIYMAGSTIGTLTGGYLADNWGGMRTIRTGMILSILPLFLAAYVPYGPGWFVIMFFAGLFLGMTFSTLILKGQKLIPSRGGLASGLILGFDFAAGAAAAIIGGRIADAQGFQMLFTLGAVVSAFGAVVSLFVHYANERQQ
jgi:FSR family fosmidomycin resistance protein-like MFS transporter